MGPNIWGPHGWKFIHFVAMAYPRYPTEQQKIQYKSFFLSLANVIPCTLCANNYKEHIEQYPLTDKVLQNNESLVEWTILMHNLVNKENGKKIYTNDHAIKEISLNWNLDSDKCRSNIEIRKIIDEKLNSQKGINLNQNNSEINNFYSNCTSKYLIYFIIFLICLFIIFQINISDKKT